MSSSSTDSSSLFVPFCDDSISSKLSEFIKKEMKMKTFLTFQTNVNTYEKIHKNDSKLKTYNGSTSRE